VSTILSAWARINNNIPLLVVGGGPERNSLEEEARRQGLNSIQFKGYVSRPEALAIISGARFLIFSSEWYENFPVTIAESFACGVPVLCSRIGAMKEIVKDSVTGLQFSAGDAADLAAKVEWAWNHPERMQEMGREARKEYEAKYTAEINYPLLMRIYQDAISKHHARQTMSA
jgi:glycosyltransferase involved in cell wall biosynthesis